ncbi:MAG: histidine phosphatase family protein [Candidatus ainarchaeum sp.]|jgi:broad specificity phosphatase PhoE/glycosyltransferase involved in cell wall biosynthesis|nr:histidine phosphatase family protein [Candidatus ainarchaeum sp.]MDD4128758.1 histidine phosphatase family protein [Candidatus ainarchaeum sp.]
MNNVLIINYHPLTQIGGVQSILKTIIKKNENYSILTGSYNKKEEIKNRIYSTNLIYQKKPLKELDYILNKIFVEQAPKIVYTHNLSYMFNTKIAKHIFDYFKNKGCLMIEHAHHTLIKRKNRVKKILSFDWDGLIVVSKYAAKKIFPLINKKTKKIIIYNGLDLKDFQKTDFSIRKKLGLTKKTVLLFPSRTIRLSTGKIGEQKQFKTVLKALKKIKEKQKIALLIPYLGNKNDKKIIEFYDYLRKMGLEKIVYEFPTNLNQNEMFKFYSTGDIVLFPSINESFGMIIPEAWASGKPIIGASSGAITQLIKNNKNGLLFKPKNSADLRKKIIELTTNKQKYDYLLKKGKIEVNRFTDNLMIDKITGFIKNLKKNKIIYLVRHGETTYNANHLFTGQANPPLTKKGELQAKKVKKFFSKIKNPLIYCSPLKRAKNTAKIIGLKKVIYKNELKEINVGEFESKTRKELLTKFKVNFDKITKYPKGESLKDLKVRLNNLLKEINKEKEREVIIVAHEIVNKIIASNLTKKNYFNIPRQKNNDLIIISNKKLSYISL